MGTVDKQEGKGLRGTNTNQTNLANICSARCPRALLVAAEGELRKGH